MSNDATCIVPVAEIRALMAYVAEQGLDPDAQVLAPLKQALYDHDQALDGDAKIAAEKKLLSGYAKLATLTYPTRGINGRTLVETSHIWARTRVIIVLGIAFFVFAIGNEILDQYFNSIPEPEAGWELHLGRFHSYVLTYLSPFFWGGLGACVYLAKRLSDKAHEQTFDGALLQGYQTRIWLGAVLGAIVQYIYEPSSLTTSEVNLDANAVAFLTGVGVKVVYGGIERTVASLGQALNLEGLRKARPRDGDKETPTPKENDSDGKPERSGS